MLPSSKGGGGGPSRDVPGSEASGDTTEPIGRLAGFQLADFQLATPSFRKGGPQNWEEWQSATACPASPKKRKTDWQKSISVPEDALVQAIETALRKTWRDFSAASHATGTPDDVRSLRSEMKESIEKVQVQLTQLVGTAMAKMQVEADRRADAMLRKLVQMIKMAPKHESDSPPPCSKSDATQAGTMQPSVSQDQQQSVRVAQSPSWAKITGTGAQSKTAWTTVTSGRKKSKKHPLDQRRILFTRRSGVHDCDPRDIMFEINKALAHAQAQVAVRLISLKYTAKGNLSGLMSENACAEDLLQYAAIVMPTVQRLDHAVVDVEKTEKWRKVRVHGVALDRYMSEGGLEVAREEIEVMTGEQLPYAPRWIKGDTLSERYDNGSTKRSTLVLTVKSKRAADTIMAKGLSFGGRRHEVERFWERGEGGICLHCCGRDHFGKCIGEAKCFVCAGEHEGSKHQCAVDGCGKKAEPCGHHTAKCANCKGSHMATSPRCPEKWSKPQNRNDRGPETRSSPPTMEMDDIQEDLPANGTQTTTHKSPTVGRSSPTATTPELPKAALEESIPELMMEMFCPQSLASTLQRPILVESSSDPNLMSVDNDSTST